MELSIIIVSYNVLPFLRQCIASIKEACDGMDYEMIIIDNNSTDGSALYLQNSVSECYVILNNENVGYGAGMNQGLARCKGKYVLFLNPDTIVSSESIVLGIAQLDQNKKCGAVGVRMIDGKGDFLKESKRGYPTLASAVYKSTGLSTLFPKSKRFSHYYQGHLSAENNHKIDVLTGAFCLTRKEILDQLGGFDERYFMYGEDIDLSRSITDLGYYNYYIGETSIIHFKGESTRKESIKNTFHFYNSMLLFAKKYTAKKKIPILGLTLILAVLGAWRWISLNIIPMLRRVVRFGIYVSCFYIVGQMWSRIHFKNPEYFDNPVFLTSIVIYAMALCASYYIGQASRRKFKYMTFGIALILIVYGLLPYELRSSRAVIFLGSSLILILELGWSYWYAHKSGNAWNFLSRPKKALLLSAKSDSQAMLQFLQNKEGYAYQGIVYQVLMDDVNCLTDFEHLPNYLAHNQIDTLTIHMESVSMDWIMKLMSQLGANYQYLLYSEYSQSIIFSPDSNTQGQVSIVEIRWGIDSAENRTMKRVLDIVLSISFIVFAPILIWFVVNRKNWITNIGKSLIGKFTWVGYDTQDHFLDRLPRIKPSILKIKADYENVHLKNVQYARDYSFIGDLRYIINSFGALGNKVEAHAEHK